MLNSYTYTYVWIWIWIYRERIRLFVVNPKLCTSTTHNTFHEKFYRVTQYKNYFSFRRKLFVTLFVGGKKLFVYWLEKWHLKIAKIRLASSRMYVYTVLTMFDVECGHDDDGEPFCNPMRTFEYFFIKTRHTTYAIAVYTHKHEHTNSRRSSYLFCGYYNFHNWFFTFAHKERKHISRVQRDSSVFSFSFQWQRFGYGNRNNSVVCCFTALPWTVCKS